MDDRRFWTDHLTRFNDIRAVTFGSKSVSENEAMFRVAAEQFRSYVNEDLPTASDRGSVLEIGYGLGHFTRVQKELGFRECLGLDFAAPPGPPLGRGYSYRQQDVGSPFDLRCRYDLVTAIDVLFHITDDARFAVALDNIRRHAGRFVYVTGRMEDRRFPHAPQVVCRSLDRFRSLGTLVRHAAWRNNSIACFKVA